MIPSAEDQKRIYKSMLHAAREVRTDIESPGAYTCGETIILEDGETTARIEVKLWLGFNP